MKKKVFLIADFGASNGRLLQAEFDGNRYTLSEVHRFENRPVQTGDTLYWDFLRLFSELKLGLEKAFHDISTEVVSLAIDTWGVDFGLLDKNNRLLSNPVHYRDTRRHGARDKLFSLISEEDLFSVSGFIQATIMSVFQLIAMRSEDDPVLSAADSLLFMPDLFAHYLTGEKFNEASIALGSLLYNINSHAWDLPTITKLGLPEHIFQSLIEPTREIGTLQTEIAEEVRGNQIPLIAPASHDTASAVAGIPLIDDDTPWGFISLGTWAVAGTRTERPVMDFSVWEKGFGNEFSLGGITFIAQNITALWIIQQCKRAWESDFAGRFAWEQIISEAESSPSFPAFIDVDNPEFAQLQPDMPKTIRAYCTRTGQQVPESRGAIGRCVFESLIMRWKKCFIEIEAFTKRGIGRVHIIGGGSKNRFLCQGTADALGIPVYAGPVEATATGNLLAQLSGTDTISTLEEGYDIIRRSNSMQVYEPGPEDDWQEAYERYINIATRT